MFFIGGEWHEPGFYYPTGEQRYSYPSFHGSIRLVPLKSYKSAEPEHRRWKVLFAGKPRGTASFWQQLADQLTSRIPEIDQVIFQWEEQLGGNRI